MYKAEPGNKYDYFSVIVQPFAFYGVSVWDFAY